MTANPYTNTIAAELKLPQPSVSAVAELLKADATIPFIARYRKEATGSLDEVAIALIRDRLMQLKQLDERRHAILKSLEQNGHLNETLEASVMAVQNLAELEDLYLPYRPKRRTKATIAREKGLQPLADLLMSQCGTDPETAAQPYIDTEKGVTSVDEALAGARDIIAEQINENSTIRADLRDLFFKKAVLKSTLSKGMDEKGAKFKDYFDWQEPAATAPSHRILAMRRGEAEDVLNVSIQPDPESALEIIMRHVITSDGADAHQVQLAAEDSYRRLLSRAMETETRLLLKTRADEQAIQVFADNLRELLLASPLGAKRILGIDPGLRTGCKIVSLDRQGKLLDHGVIYLSAGARGEAAAAETLRQWCQKFKTEAIAVGNGTGGRETQQFVQELKDLAHIPVIMVNESGASIYSASQVAREEFPDLDLTLRGAVSIGRRLMDPLAELVKIDPKSIGVGQYQHDVDQTALKQSLDDMVVSCVNQVGVDLNRASVQLLTYVSGLGPQLAKNIVLHRDAHGPYTGRKSLLKVSRLGPKAYEQCAGFLRIADSPNPLDGSAVHPERYALVDQMAADLTCSVSDLMRDAGLREKIRIQTYVSETVGLPTLKDILAELAKPGRDPRQQFELFQFEASVNTPTDLKPGMRLPGIVTNVTDFGAFVDVGVHQDGLVHISQLADRFIKRPSDIVRVNQKVMVTVLEVDLNRKRIALSMRSGSPVPRDANPPKAKSGSQAKSAPRKNAKPQKKPFNNPFADLLSK